MRAEARGLVQHGVLPSLAGRERAGWRDLYVIDCPYRLCPDGLYYVS
jgi:hypothetical protein